MPISFLVIHMTSYEEERENLAKEMAEQIEACFSMDIITEFKEFGCPDCGCTEFYLIEERNLGQVNTAHGLIDVYIHEPPTRDSLLGRVLLCQECDWRYWFG